MNKKFIDDIPPLFKGIISIAALAGASYGIYKLAAYIKQKNAEKETAAEVEATASEASRLKKAGIKPTLNEVQLKNMVNGIKIAFLNYDPITRAHVQPLYGELVKIANDLDTLNLINSYGIQEIDFPALKFTANDFKGNLTESVKNFLNREEIAAANGILARKGIKYRF